MLKSADKGGDGSENWLGLSGNDSSVSGSAEKMRE